MNADLPEKLLEEHADVFSDILNVFLFSGEQIVQPEDLEDFLPKSQYKAEQGVLHEEERDVAKRWKKNQINISSIGLENQSKYYKFMPLRIIGYDGANYREQLLDRKMKRAYPVISVVLNFSMRRWRSNLNLRDCLDIPECLSSYINDYRIHVFDVAFLTDQQLNLFRSDFKIVAEYFVDRRRKRPFRFPAKIPAHVDEILKLLTVITGDKRFTEGWKIPAEQGKEDMNMAEKWIDEIEERGEKRGVLKGRKEGRKEGRQEGRQEGLVIGQITAYYDDGHDPEFISAKVKKSVSYVKRVLGLEPAADEG